MMKSMLLKQVGRVVVVVVAAIIFTTLLRTNYTSIAGGVETMQYFALLIVGAICAIVAFVLMIVARNKLHWGDVGVIAMIIYILLHSFLSESMEGRELYISLAYFALYFLARAVKIFGLNQYLSFAIMGIGVWQSTLVLSQLWGGTASLHSRFIVTGSFYNPGPCGVFLSAIFAFAVAYIKMGERGTRVNIINIRYLFAIITAVVSFIALGATLSRAGWLGACIALLILYRKEIIIWFRNRRSRLIYTMAIGLVLVIAIGVYSMKRDSANGRLFIWHNTMSALADVPIFGVGIDKFAGVYAQQQHNFFAEHNALTRELPQIWIAGTPQSAFNEPLALLLLLGTVGAIFAYFILYHKMKRENQYSYIAIALLIGSLFSYPFYIPAIGALFVIAISQLPDTMVKISNIVTTSYNIILSGLCVFIGYVCYNKHKDIKAYVQWQKLYVFYNIEDYESIIEDYSTLYYTLSYNNTFLFEYGRSLSKIGRYQESNCVLLKGASRSSDPMFWNIIGDNYQALKQYDNSAESYLRAYNICPARIYPLYLLAKLYHNIDDNDKTRLYGEILLNKKIKIPSPAVDDMRSEIKELIKP